MHRSVAVFVRTITMFYDDSQVQAADPNKQTLMPELRFFESQRGTVAFVPRLSTARVIPVMSLVASLRCSVANTTRAVATTL